MANFSNAPWDGSASKYASPDEWCNACLIDENPSGKDKVKGLCKLPVKTPDGTPNVNAIHAAAAALAGGRGGVQASPAAKKAAAKKLVSLYSSMKQDCPPSIKNMAS